jgi:hypothetical protein
MTTVIADFPDIHLEVIAHIDRASHQSRDTLRIVDALRRLIREIERAHPTDHLRLVEHDVETTYLVMR